MRGGKIIPIADNDSAEKNMENVISESQCAPGNPGITLKNGKITCFSFESLLGIAKAYNKYYGEHKIPYKNIYAKYKKLPTDTNKSALSHEIWKQLSDNIKTCKSKSETCWIEQPFLQTIKEDDLIDMITKETFKPRRPLGKRQWLSNFDIEDVMAQYTRLYPDFLYYGPYPSDIFEPSVKVLFGMPFTDYESMVTTKSGDIAKYIAMTFNTDPHTKSGAHWVSLAILPRDDTVYFNYFDSVGRHPNRNINIFINELIESCKKSGMHKKGEFNINQTQHQRKNTECGVYSINYILNVIHDVPFDDIVKKVMSDDLTVETRNIHFAEY